MQDEQIVALILSNARESFKHPDLAYDDATVFREIRGFDSAQAVQFILAIEGACGQLLSEEEVDNMNTFGDLRALLHAKAQVG